MLCLVSAIRSDDIQCHTSVYALHTKITANSHSESSSLYDDLKHDTALFSSSC